MEANELRLGNLVYFPNISKEATVNLVILQSVLYGTERYEPIPITDEQLLKYGFVKDFYRINDQTVPERFIEDDVMRLEDEIHLYCKDGVWWFMDEYDSLLSFKRPMQGVHDLQNLFFALKGKELTLK